MLRFRKTLLLSLSLLTLNSKAQDFEFSERRVDNQIWSRIQIDKDINKRLNLGFQYQIRLGEFGQKFNWSYFYLTSNYKLNKHWTAILNYQWGTSYKTDWNAIFGGFSYKKKLNKKFDFSYRIAVQHQRPYFGPYYDSDNKPVTELRNRFLLRYDLPHKMSVFCFSEPFIRFESGEVSISKVRNVIGFQWEFRKNHTINPFFMWQPDVTANKPTDKYILCVNYRISLPRKKKEKTKEIERTVQPEHQEH